MTKMPEYYTLAVISSDGTKFYRLPYGYKQWLNCMINLLRKCKGIYVLNRYPERHPWYTNEIVEEFLWRIEHWMKEHPVDSTDFTIYKS